MIAFDRQTTAFQDFIGGMRQQWANRLYPALREEARERLAGRLPSTAEDVAEAVADSATYQWFAWIERHFQRMKYSDPRWGLVAAMYGRSEAVAEALAAADDSRRLELDPALAMPEYYAAVDIHQHPGNLTGAAFDGLVYQLSATSIHPNTRRFEAHERFVDWLKPRGPFARVLDMGCGFGKSTTPLARVFRDAEVIGIDISEPCLRLAAVEADALQAENLRYAQRDLRATGYADGSFDLVTSTQVLHELPLKDVERTLAESFRLLRPGGLVVHLDFRAEDPWAAFLIESHAGRNNEGYLPPFNRMDVRAAYERAGFEAVEIEPFAEREGALAPDMPFWRFPWTLFAGRKPATGRA